MSSTQLGGHKSRMHQGESVAYRLKIQIHKERAHKRQALKDARLACEHIKDAVEFKREVRRIQKQLTEKYAE